MARSGVDGYWLNVTISSSKIDKQIQPPSWELFGTFLAVMRLGSLSGAARQLGITQPTARRRIESLEDQLGTPLFSRSQNGLLPTATARSLLPFAETMEATARALVRAADDAEGMAGTVRITASEVIGTEVLPALLQPLRVSSPQIQLELALSDANQDLLRRDADVAVRMARPQGAGLVARRVGAVEIGFFATRGYLEQTGVPASPGALREHALVGYDRDPRLLDGLTAMGLELERSDFAVRTDDDRAVLAAIRAGLGIGVCQAPLARRTGLVRVLPEVVFPLEIWLVAHQDLRDVPRIRAVLDHLAPALAAYARDEA